MRCYSPDRKRIDQPGGGRQEKAMDKLVVSRSGGGRSMETVWVWAAVFVVCCVQVCSGCHPWELRCLNGDCVKATLRCDAKVDCPDASDELNCAALSPTVKWAQTACNADQFQCRNGRCVYPGWRCDGQDDCGDQSDEKSCPKFEHGPVLSMGSIIGLSVAVAGLFMVVIAIAVMLTCIRRKNVMNAREMARQNRLFQQDRYPYSISGMVLDREPPPRYSSQADLTLFPPGVLQEHLANLQPPPYYSSQPDLRPATYSPQVLEAPPCYSSQHDLSSSGVTEDLVDEAIQSQSSNVARSSLFQMSNSQVMMSALNDEPGSLDRRRGGRSCAKDSNADSKVAIEDGSGTCGKDPRKPKDLGIHEEDQSSQRDVNPKQEDVGGMEEYGRSRRQAPTASGGSHTSTLRLANRCVSTPILTSPSCFSDDIGADSCGPRNTTRRTPIEKRINNSESHNSVNNRARQYRKQPTHRLATVSHGQLNTLSIAAETRPQPQPDSHVSMDTVFSRDTDYNQQLEIPGVRAIQSPPLTVHTHQSIHSNHRGVADEHSSSATMPVMAIAASDLCNQGLLTPGLHKVTPNRLQSQKRLSKSMSTLTSECSLYRQDSFNSVTSWDC